MNEVITVNTVYQAVIKYCRLYCAYKEIPITDSQLKVFSAYMYKYAEMKNFRDMEEFIYQVLWSSTTTKWVATTYCMSVEHVRVVKGELRKLRLLNDKEVPFDIVIKDGKLDAHFLITIVNETKN